MPVSRKFKNLRETGISGRFSHPPSLSVAELVEAMSVEAGADVSPVPLDLLGERANRRPSLSRPGCSQNIGKQENIKPGYNENLILTAIRSALQTLLFPFKDTP